MKRAAIWAAVSSKQQAKPDKISLDLQREACKAKVQELGANLVAELVVPGQSRDIVLFEDACKSVSAYADLRHLVENRKIDLLVCYTKSRLGRTVALCETVVGYCRVNGVGFYDLNAPPSTLDAKGQLENSGDVLISAVMSATAQNDNKQRTKAQGSSMIKRVESGKMPSRIPYGYKKVFNQDGTYNLELEQAEAEAVKLIFDLYQNGKGLMQIANELIFQGIATPTGEGSWSQGNIRHIFERIWIYAGYVEIHKKSGLVRAKGTHPAIIAEETLSRINAERYERGKARRSVGKGVRLWSRVVLCERCNRLMNCTTTGKWPLVDCPGCRKSVQISKIIKAMHAALEQWKGLDFEVAEKVDTTPLQSEIERLQSELSAIEKSLSRANRAFTDDLMSYEAYSEQVKRLNASKKHVTEQMTLAESRLMALRTRQQRILEAPTAQELAEMAKQMLQADNIQAANAWLREWLKITFTADRKIVVSPKWFKIEE